MASSEEDPVLRAAALPRAGPWPTEDPFLFSVHHDDNFPAGNDDLGPATSLRGRNIGADFANKDGWNMYHGETVPGFPKHPHRGFETVTIARSGLVDHSDSLGAAGRFGGGDVQWMTAGKGVEHCEMFPLLDQEGSNRLELFQIWLNLPAKSKMVPPFFAMLWSHEIPHLKLPGVEVAAVCGQGYTEDSPPPPPPHSWASEPGAHLGILTIKLEPGATWTLPAAPSIIAANATAGGRSSRPQLRRCLYFFVGDAVEVGGRVVRAHSKLDLDPSLPAVLTNPPGADVDVEFLLLEGAPIGEPVAQHGPFVMNSRDQILQAFEDYQRTRFGRWPWRGDDPVHPRNRGRFAKYPDGREEEPPTLIATHGGTCS